MWNSLPLSIFKNTLLAVDKDLYFNEVMLLRLVWNPVARVAFASSAPLAAQTAQNNAIIYTAGVPSPADTTGATVPKAAGATVINNLQMLLAIEENLMIANDIKTKVLSPGGLSLLTPFIYTSKISLNAATLQTITLRYNWVHGATLLKVYHGVYNTTEALNTIYDHSNVNPNKLAGTKVTSFYTQLNNSRLQEFDLTSASGDEWTQLKDSLAGSSILSSNMYYYKWFWRENFEHVHPIMDLPMKPDAENLIKGLSLDTEQKIDIFLTTPNAAYNHYSFGITQKLLSISSEGVMVS